MIRCCYRIKQYLSLIKQIFVILILCCKCFQIYTEIEKTLWMRMGIDNSDLYHQIDRLSENISMINNKIYTCNVCIFRCSVPSASNKTEFQIKQSWYITRRKQYFPHFKEKFIILILYCKCFQIYTEIAETLRMWKGVDNSDLHHPVDRLSESISLSNK